MKVAIVVECEDVQDLMAHLSVIRQRIRYELKSDEQEINFDDENVYGSHKVLIEK